MAAVSFCSAECLEESNRHEATSVGKGRVAGLVPIGIVFAANDVEKVASRETQLLIRLSGVIVQRFDDLRHGLDQSVTKIPPNQKEEAHKARQSGGKKGEKIM